MPFADVAGASLHYRFDGTAGAPVVMLSNSLGTDLSMWDPQVPALVARYRLLRYDTRGHGRSTATPGPYDRASRRMRLACSTRSGSSASTFADCRWAAWSGSGSERTHRNVSTS